MQYVYYEPIKGQVYRLEVIKKEEGKEVSAPVGGLGSVGLPELPSADGSFRIGELVLWPETQEWKDKYQDSLSLRVSQHSVTVYFLMPIKRGKNNSRVLVIDDNGATYSLLVPTMPFPRFGQSFNVLRLDLTVISVVPAMDLLDKVKEAREKDNFLL
jgi:hypothetical protein